MKYLNRKEFFKELNKKIPHSTGGWFYNNFEDYLGRKSYDLSEKISLDTLIKRTIKIPEILNSSYPLYIFNDHVAGWKHSKKFKYSPIVVDEPEILENILRNKNFFRDPERYEDNYYITNKQFDWFVIFCHHSDWHFSAKPNVVKKIKAKLKGIKQKNSQNSLPPPVP